ncbi:hypothetical protein C8R44DRAFT_747076 [Mycena epipterygia]|nr:hypothetical protein C8R44DRAFT_747076 [Mycena epipterygia]
MWRGRGACGEDVSGAGMVSGGGGSREPSQGRDSSELRGGVRSCVASCHLNRAACRSVDHAALLPWLSSGDADFYFTERAYFILCDSGLKMKILSPVLDLLAPARPSASTRDSVPLTGAPTVQESRSRSLHAVSVLLPSPLKRLAPLQGICCVRPAKPSAVTVKSTNSGLRPWGSIRKLCRCLPQIQIGSRRGRNQGWVGSTHSDDHAKSGMLSARKLVPHALGAKKPPDLRQNSCPAGVAPKKHPDFKA